ncbi:AMP-binding protein [Aminobacter sp. MSH1]|uniref:class I adenylate-forming enzyme family protein n=1 Tax=Aminobacter sp. MSH1 TaxID=374606 RepID=UPI00131F3486|nr:AMP-binding protein [Aminobacter sp. MSH1]
MNLAALFTNIARRIPDRVAVSDLDIVLTYEAMALRTRAIAGAFLGGGLRPGDRVALCMENCPEFLEILVACWTAGLCAVPMNVKLHRKEVDHIVADSGAKALVTTPGVVDSLGEIAGRVPSLSLVVCTGTADYTRMASSEGIAPLVANPEDPAWLFYTSGTTGRPKGATLSHRNLLAMCMAYYADIDALDPTDTMLHVAPLSHGAGLYSLPHLLKGSHQIIGHGFDLDFMGEVLENHRNLSMFLVPTTLSRLVQAASGSERLKIQNVKTICYGGAPMYVEDLRTAVDLFKGRLFHLYGQGETPMTIAGLSKAMHTNDADETTLRSCGVARTGISIRILGEDDIELPIGEVGEVVTRSDCVMNGYWNNEAASVEALRGGWLHTGDLGSLDERGFLTLKDRSKDLIISGGTNIYPREVEEILLKHPDVLEAAVVGQPHPDWGEEVVAYLVVRPGNEVGVQELDALCIANIARFKRPKSYHFVKSLPKSDYGKILKTKLRELAAPAR